jgi:hypothetical protein
MAQCFMCNSDRDTRKVFVGSARGFSDLCIDCIIKFYKIRKED